MTRPDNDSLDYNLLRDPRVAALGPSAPGLILHHDEHGSALVVKSTTNRWCLEVWDRWTGDQTPADWADAGWEIDLHDIGAGGILATLLPSGSRIVVNDRAAGRVWNVIYDHPGGRRHTTLDRPTLAMACAEVLAATRPGD